MVETRTERPVVVLSEDARQQAMKRFAVIRPHVEEGACQTELARRHHVAVSTVRRWVRAYRVEGLAGLARKARADRGQVRGLPKELVQLVEGLALSTVRRPLTAIHRLVREVASEQGWPVPSYAQVSRIAGGLPTDLVTLAREGVVGYREAFDLLYRREARCANAIWQADHCRLPIYVRGEQGRVERPVLTVIEDDYSRAVMGYRLSVTAPSAASTSLALRQAIWVKDETRWPMCGVPECFYTDHGRDFTSTHLEAVAADLKMTLIFSQVGRPRGRGKVERFFRTLEALVLAMLPGYVRSVHNLREQRAVVVRAKSAASLTLADLDSLVRTWVVERYHQQEHTQTGRAPLERWRQSDFVPQLPASVAHLDLLLLQPRRQRVVQQEGITFQGAWYLHPLLGDSVGEAVSIRYDPQNLASIRVYVSEAGSEERFLCQASCVERGGEAVSYQEIVEARVKRRKRVGKALRERKRVVQQYASDEQLARRALDQVCGGTGASDTQAELAVEAASASSSVQTTSEGAQTKRRRWYEDE